MKEPWLQYYANISVANEVEKVLPLLHGRKACRTVLPLSVKTKSK